MLVFRLQYIFFLPNLKAIHDDAWKMTSFINISAIRESFFLFEVKYWMILPKILLEAMEKTAKILFLNKIRLTWWYFECLIVKNEKKFARTLLYTSTIKNMNEHRWWGTRGGSRAEDEEGAVGSIVILAPRGRRILNQLILTSWPCPKQPDYLSRKRNFYNLARKKNTAHRWRCRSTRWFEFFVKKVFVLSFCLGMNAVY